MCVYLCVCEYRYHRVQKRVSGPLKAEFQVVVSCLMQVMGTELRSFVREGCALLLTMDLSF